jgi:hydroxymethylglutaryl-CoA lyase
MSGIKRRDGVDYSVLTPNLKGFDAALTAKADEIAVFASASERFSQHNINCSIAESFERFAPVVEAAQAAGIPVRGYVSCVVECPYDGATPPAQVASVARALIDMGCYQISLGDTIGRATPASVDAMLAVVLKDIPADRFAGHFHDTAGRAIDNIDISLKHGLRCFDSSISGLGGCPYAPGAAGNVATETVVSHLAALGFDTGIDQDKLETAARFAATLRTTS